MTATVLVIHDSPDLYFQTLSHSFSELTFHIARNDVELDALMVRIQPDILFSFRCDGISTSAQTRAARADCVQWIQIAGAGHDHIGDLAKIHCPVSNCGGVLSNFQAETIIGAMISLNFGFFRYRELQQQKIYRKLPWNSLVGQKLLVIGFGHIGKALARNGKHFGMHITAIRTSTKATPEADETYTLRKLPELLPNADFVSLHLPHTKATDQFFDKKMFSAMKKSSYFINTARGGVVNEEDLIQALQERQISGAYLDVFATEPLPASSPLWELGNALLSPHYCDAVTDWHERFADFFAGNLRRWLGAESMHNLIHP